MYVAVYQVLITNDVDNAKNIKTVYDVIYLVCYNRVLKIVENEWLCLQIQVAYRGIRTFPGQDVSRRTFPVQAGRFPDRMFPVHILSGNRLSAEMPLIYIIYLLSQTYCHLIVLCRDIHM